MYFCVTAANTFHQCIEVNVKSIFHLVSHLVELSCTTLEDPTYGTQSCDSDFLRITTTCNFTCSPGYNLEGSDERTCLPTITWSGETARCAPKQCSNKLIDPPLFASVFQPCTTNFNTSCPVRCVQGYVQSNESDTVNSIMCKLEEDGNTVDWTRDPVCISKCCETVTVVSAMSTKV